MSAAVHEFFRKPVDGAGAEQLLATLGTNSYPSDWSSDGKWIVFRQDGDKTGQDLWLLPLSGDRKPVPYLATPAAEYQARFSPDGRWMAYTSNESGQPQVYVQAIPASGPKWQISQAGGSSPYWRHDGKEMFYLSADQKVMAVPVKIGTSVEPETPQEL